MSFHRKKGEDVFIADFSQQEIASLKDGDLLYNYQSGGRDSWILFNGYLHLIEYRRISYGFTKYIEYPYEFYGSVTGFFDKIDFGVKEHAKILQDHCPETYKEALEEEEDIIEYDVYDDVWSF